LALSHLLQELLVLTNVILHNLQHLLLLLR
jgi:hypothetical protein